MMLYLVAILENMSLYCASEQNFVIFWTFSASPRHLSIHCTTWTLNTKPIFHFQQSQIIRPPSCFNKRRLPVRSDRDKEIVSASLLNYQYYRTKSRHWGKFGSKSLTLRTLWYYWWWPFLVNFTAVESLDTDKKKSLFENYPLRW